MRMVAIMMQFLLEVREDAFWYQGWYPGSIRTEVQEHLSPVLLSPPHLQFSKAREPCAWSEN